MSRALWLKHEHPTYDRVGSTFLGRENARDLWVSTVWLGPLLAWPGQPFETMIFSEDRDDQAQWRWPTLRQAQIGHRQVVRAVRRALHVPVPLARPYPRGHW